MSLTHFDEQGNTHMVDISQKNASHRVAIASGKVRCSSEVISAIRNQNFAKGDVLSVAQLAGIMGSKRTSELIPLCHLLPIDSVQVELHIEDESSIEIRSTVQTVWKTGVEMEALTAVSVAALTVIDMVKSMDKSVYIEHIKLLHKRGGKSGNWNREI